MEANNKHEANRTSSAAGKMAKSLSLGQGTFYLATGIWPLVRLRSFERVTGPKTDKLLVKTVGILITAGPTKFVSKSSPA